LDGAEDGNEILEIPEQDLQDDEEDEEIVQERPKQRLDSSKRMNVDALVKARQSTEMDALRRVENQGSYVGLVDKMFQEKMRDMEEAAERGSSTESDLEKRTWGGLPVPECHMDVVHQANVERRFFKHQMSEDEVLEYIDADQRDRGNFPRDEQGHIIPPTYPPKLGGIPMRIEEHIYPDQDVMLHEVMTVVRSHMISCHNEECIEKMGRDEQWWFDRLNALNYTALLHVWRQREIYDLPHDYFEDPHQVHLVRGQFVRDAGEYMLL
jgi:hypothetical protein